MILKYRRRILTFCYEFGVDMESLVFGDVFKLREKEYIFLTKTEEVLYAAEILNKEMSTEVVKGYNSALKNNKEVAQRNVVYCFVALSTRELEGRVAHLGRPDQGGSSMIEKLTIALDKKDIKAIKEEIENRATIPQILKESVVDIQI